MMMTTVSFEHGMSEEGAPRSNVNLVITDLKTAPIDINSLDDFAAIVREQLSMAVDSLSFVHEKVSLALLLRYGGVAWLTSPDYPRAERHHGRKGRARAALQGHHR
jgi:hypothetical protein